MSKINEASACMLCSGYMLDIVDLGEMYPSGFYRTKHNLEKVPIVLCRCTICSLVQLRYRTTLDMYSQYWYRSGLNRSMRRDLKNIVTYIENSFGISPGDRFLDIGCNDGTMLSFLGPDIYKVGVDPSRNVGVDAMFHTDRFVNNYFSSHYFSGEKFDIITSIAMFYDIEEPARFTEEVKSVLDKDGVWIIQMTDLHSMFSLNAFDNICLEHVAYWSLKPLLRLFHSLDLDIVDISYNEVNGGSVRVAVKHKGAEVLPSVSHWLGRELVSPMHIHLFKQGIESSRKATRKFISSGNVYGYGASTKGNTLLQYFGLTGSDIKAIGEVNTEKFGMMTVGSDIPIVPEDDVLSVADKVLVLPWHFEADILPRYPHWVGDWFFPLPTPHISSSRIALKESETEGASGYL